MPRRLRGRTPEYRFHLDEHRRGTFAVRLDARLDDLADWGAVGKLIGEAHQDYFAVPVFHGYGRAPTADELKHLGAALASYGSMGMFHFMGVTPEAPATHRGREKSQSPTKTFRRSIEATHSATATPGWWCSPGRSSRSSK